MAKKKYYAVKVGKVPGIYSSWKECEEQIKGYPKAEYKGFSTLPEAEAFLGEKPEKNLSMKKENTPPASNLNKERRIEDPLERNILKAYVDGSFNKDRMEYSCGVVLIFNGKELHFSKKGSRKELAEMRNVAGELLGAQYAMAFALKNLGKFKELWVYHDYEGIAKWCTGEWKAKQEGTMKYRDYYLEKIADRFPVRFMKVRAHSGDKYNDLADQLAKEALE